jgi:hypothetical protein
MTLDLHKALTHSGREKKGEKKRKEKSQDPTTTITMLLLFLEGEKTNQQRRQQVQKRKRGSGVCVCVWSERNYVLGIGWVFSVYYCCANQTCSAMAHTERKRERGEGGGWRARARGMIATTNVSFGVRLSRRQCSLGNDKKQTTKQIELKLRWGWWVGR